MSADLTAFPIGAKKIHELPGSADGTYAAVAGDADSLFFIGDKTTGKLYKITKAELATLLGGGSIAFTDLTDVPSAYTGAANKVVSVKSDETGLEFTDASGGGGSARFGVSDEDDIATEDRTFNANSHTIALTNAAELYVTAVSGFSQANLDIYPTASLIQSSYDNGSDPQQVSYLYALSGDLSSFEIFGSYTGTGLLLRSQNNDASNIIDLGITKDFIKVKSQSGDLFSISSSGVVSIPNTPSYANNAAAITGGLTAGQLYRNGDQLQIVH